MDTSVTIIGIVIAIIVAIPLYFSARTNAVNKTKILNIKKKFCSNPQDFGLTESQSNKTLTIDQKNKKFILMNFNPNQQESTFVNLETIASSKIVLTTEGSSETIIKIDFEFLEKETSKKIIIPFYDFDDDRIKQISVYQDHQFAKKWLKIIQDCL